MWKDFKEFAFQGNVLDLAVAVVIGAAFGQIVTSLVENVIMPLIGGLFGGIHFEGIVYKIGDATVEIGVFIQSVFDFFIISASIFLFVRLLMKFKRKQDEEEEEEVDPQEALLTEIRDLLAEQNKKN
ncbi:MAG TPA: large conductance mechanosensitive channel protein MscL [Bacillota bacterium]|nr:large conductance mechanosensitive channel protein MscL [Bacillota bacterium]